MRDRRKIQESIKDAMQKYAIKLKYEIPPRKNKAANKKPKKWCKKKMSNIKIAWRQLVDGIKTQNNIKVV